MLNRMTELALTRRPVPGGKMSPFLPWAYSFRKSPSSESSDSCSRVTAWCTTGKPSADGLVSTALIQRSTLSPVGENRSPHQLAPSAGTTNGSGIGTIQSGSPMCHMSRSANWRGGGRSSGLPRGAPASTQATTVSICSWLSERSYLKPWTPTLGSMNQGGMVRDATLSRIARAQGRVSW